MSRPCLSHAAEQTPAPRFPTARPLALAVHLIVFGGAFALAAHAPAALAQSAPQATATRAYDIPAGPLSSALVRFAREAGVSLVGAGNAADGKSSPGLKGSYTVQGGFAALLAGSGLEAFRQADGSYGLRPAPVQDKSGETVLAPVQVSAQSVRDGTTEGTGAYTTRSVNTATKLPLTLKETPQTMTVVTRQQMDDFNLTTVDDVLQSTTGVYAQRILLGSGYTSRGFALATQYDGIPSVAGLGATSFASPDSAFLDHAEVQQGAAGLLNGAGQPGGTINLVRKRPTEDFQAHIEASYGRWDRKRLVGDISGSLVQSGAIRGRAVVVSDTGNTFVDHAHNDKQGFYGVIEALPSDNTKVGLSFQYQKSDYNEPSGVPSAADGSSLGFSRSTFVGVPHGGVNSEDVRTTAYLEQKLASDWVLKANYTHSEYTYDALLGFIRTRVNESTGDFTIRQQYYDRKTTADSVDVFASGPIEILGRRHEFALGANGYQSHYQTVNTWVGNNTAINLYNPDYSFSTPHIGFQKPVLGPKDETKSRGIWGVARLNLTDSLKFIVGTRLSWYSYKNTAGVQTMEEKAVVTPYAGLIYDLNKQYSVYASYSDIFTPQSVMDRTGNVLEPIVGANTELGIKGEFFDGQLNAAAAVFNLEQTNRPLQDTAFGNPNTACSGWCYIAADKVISQGVDLSLNGAITPNWNIFASYTYVKSEFASGAQKDTPVDPRVPKRSLRLATTYRLPGTDWTVGGNMRAQSRVYNGIVEQSGYALFGLTAKYQLNKQTEISGLVDNLFDRTYWYPNTIFTNQYGAPRSFSLKLKYQF